MDDDDDDKALRDAKHALANARQEKRALKGLLDRAADELEKLADADCDADAIARAEQTAKRLRKAAHPTKPGS